MTKSCFVFQNFGGDVDNLFKIKQRVTLTRLSIFVKVNFKIQKNVKNAQDFALQKLFSIF